MYIKPIFTSALRFLLYLGLKIRAVTNLVEEVYLQPILRYTHPSHQVCHLHNALYGLKQAP